MAGLKTYFTPVHQSEARPIIEISSRRTQGYCPQPTAQAALFLLNIDKREYSPEYLAK
ncbi:MAG: hypothetical protein IJQ29_09365 [Synergistaceae bacterium]|nr:hypothetical protein [Synergistaceae bacterium]